MIHSITMNNINVYTYTHTRFAVKSWNILAILEIFVISLTHSPILSMADFVLTLTDKRIFIYLFVCLLAVFVRNKSHMCYRVRAREHVRVASTWSLNLLFSCDEKLHTHTDEHTIHGQNLNTCYGRIS